MDTDLHAIKSSLAEVTDSELHALIDATYKVPQLAPGLLAWIEAACDWELNASAMLALFDAIVGLLTGSERRHCCTDDDLIV